MNNRVESPAKVHAANVCGLKRLIWLLRGPRWIPQRPLAAGQNMLPQAGGVGGGRCIPLLRMQFATNEPSSAAVPTTPRCRADRGSPGLCLANAP